MSLTSNLDGNSLGGMIGPATNMGMDQALAARPNYNVQQDAQLVGSIAPFDDRIDSMRRAIIDLCIGELVRLDVIPSQSYAIAHDGEQLRVISKKRVGMFDKSYDDLTAIEQELYALATVTQKLKEGAK